MQVTVLGCWGAYPAAGGACSGYLVRAGETSLLLDCGTGVLANLQKHLDFRRLNGVIITHLHHDHYLDLYPLRQALLGAQRDGSRREPLKVWLPEGPPEPRAQIAGYSEVFAVRNIPDLNYPPAGWPDREIGELRVRFWPTVHPLPCYAVSIESHGRRLVYSADTAWSEELVAFCSGADLLICEASLQDVDAHRTGLSHLSAAQAGTLARRAGVSHLLLTHFWPEYCQTTTKRQAAEAFGHPVWVAAEGKTVRVG